MMDRLTQPSAAMEREPEALADEVAELNRSHANDRVYVALLEHSAQAELTTQDLPQIPLSMANVLEPLKEAQKMRLSVESAVEVGSMGTGYAVTGSQVLTVDVQ